MMHPTSDKDQNQMGHFKEDSAAVRKDRVLADEFAYRMGVWIGEHPVKTMVLTLLLAVGCGAGLMVGRLETRTVRLWVPQASQAYVNFELVEDKFGSEQYNRFFADLRNGYDNMLTMAAFEDLWDLDTRIRSARVDGKTLADLCTQRSTGRDGCWSISLLDFWDSYEDYNQTVSTDKDIQKKVSGGYFASGAPVFHDTILGYPVTSEKNSSIYEAAGATMVTYFIDPKRASDSTVLKWEAEFTKLGGVKGAPENPQLVHNYDVIRTIPESYRGLDAELVRTIVADAPLLLMEYLIMFVFLFIILSVQHKRIRGLLTVGVVGSVILATLAAYGLCSWCGIPLTQIHLVLPFIIVGIGVDDGLILVDTFRRHTDRTPPPDMDSKPHSFLSHRIGQTLERCGSSIAYTSWTDTMAFGLGTVSSIPAIQYFCAYAAVSVLFDFFFQVTLFVAIVAIDERRLQSSSKPNQAAGKLSGPSPSMEHVATAGADGSDPRGFPLSPNEGDGQDTSFTSSYGASVQRRLSSAYVTCLSTPAVLAGCLLLFVAITGTMGYGITTLTEDFEAKDLLIYDSYIRDLMIESTKAGLFPWEDALPYNVFFRKVDTAVPENQESMLDVLDDLVDLKRSTGPSNSWLRSFLQDCSSYGGVPSSELYGCDAYLDANGYFTGQGSSNRTAYGSYMRGFLNSTGVLYATDLVFDELEPVTASEYADIKMSRMSLFHYRMATVDKKIQAMTATYGVCKDSALPHDQVFAFSEAYIYITQFTVLEPETLINLGCSISAIALVSYLVLKHFTLTAIVIIATAAIDLDVLGSLALLWDRSLNSITIVPIVLAVGIVIDYMAHVVYYFLNAPAAYSVEDAFRYSFNEVGVAVLLGAVTNLIGLAPLAFASSYIFFTFFLVFLTITLLAVLHGFVIVPASIITLSKLGYNIKRTPVPHRESQQVFAAAEEQL